MTQAVEAAHLAGRIYKDRGQWRCTSHGGHLSLSEVSSAFVPNQSVLKATCCNLEVKP